MYMYNWTTLLYPWNEHNTVNQQYTKKKKFEPNKEKNQKVTSAYRVSTARVSGFEYLLI